MRYIKLQIQLTQEQYDQLKEHAQENDLSMSAVIRQALREFFKKKKKED